MNIYVGNLSLEVTEEEDREGIKLPLLHFCLRYTIYIHYSEGKAAIAALNDKALRHMTINVIEALPLSDKKGDGSYIAKRGGWSSSRVRQRRYKIS